jgi:hypothetical protein
MLVTKQTNKARKEPFQLKKSTANSRVQQLTFDLLPQKPIELAFDGEDVSGSGGLLLAAQAEQFTGFLKRAADKLTDHRTQSLIKHNTFEQVAQRVFQIIAGFPAADDSDFMRIDPALKAAVGRNPITGEDLASQPTQRRFENGRTYKELYKLSEWLVQHYIECHPKAPKRLVLDFDGSAIETFGVQLNAFYRSGPYKKFMYFPLFVFDQNGWLLVAALRPGDHGEVQLALPVLKRLVKMLRKAWPNVEIVVRADGAFTSPKLYQWMDENRVKYALGLKHNNALLSKSKHSRSDARDKFVRKQGQPRYLGKHGKKKKNAELKKIRGIPSREERLEENDQFNSRRVRTFGDFKYKADSWDRERRVIARCDYTDAGLEVRYIVTNITKVVAKLVYEQIYCRRALCEGWIKNMKETNCHRMSCSQFKANAFRLLLHAMAYSLIHQVQMRLPTRTSFTQFQRKYIFVAVHIKENRHTVHFRMAKSYSHAKEFRQCAKRLGAQSLVAA